MSKSTNLFFYLLFYVVSFQSFAQARLPVAPNTEAFNQYSDYPVSEYTGVAKISIPIFNLNGININLRYHSSGIKVAQEASSVGLGWNLQVGGVITQDIRGYDDFDNRYPYPSQTDVFWQLNTVSANNHYDRVNMLSEYARPHPKIMDDNYYNYNYYTAIVAGMAQPDIYTYSFGEYDGKFAINPSTKEVLLFDRSHNIKIQFTYTDQRLQTFTATSPDGTKYYFNDVIQSFEHSQYVDNVQPFLAHSFYLSKIIHPDGQQISFIYDSPTAPNGVNGPYGNVIRKEVEVKSLGPQINIVDSYATMLPTYNVTYAQMQQTYSNSPFTAHTTYHKYTKYNKVTLRRIISDKFKVFFDVSQRLDCMDEDKIDRIRIENYSGGTVKNFDFDYSYFNGEMAYYTDAARHENTRLKLNKVTETGKPPYLFNYIETNEVGTLMRLPGKENKGFDFWGYSNGKFNTGRLVNPGQMLFYDASYFEKDDDFETELNPFMFWEPTMPNYLGIYYQSTYNNGGNADKIASESHTKVGTLEQITYPEGGKTKFKYESNSFANRIYPSESDIVGEHIRDDNFSKKVVYFEVRDTVGIKLRQEFSLGDNPAIFQKIMGVESFIRIYAFNSSKTLENLSPSDPKTLFIQRNWQWTESAPTYTTQTLTNYISRNEEMFKFYPGKYMIEVEMSDDCGVQGSATNHAYVAAMLSYAKRKVRKKADNYSSMTGKGGGLRIKAIENYDNNALKSFQRYTYEEEGKTNGKLILPIMFKTKSKHISYEVLSFNFGGVPTDYNMNCDAQQKAQQINRKLAESGYPELQAAIPPCEFNATTSSFEYKKGYLLGNLLVYGFDSNPIPDMSTFGYEYYVGYDKVKIEDSKDNGGYTINYYINNVAKSHGQNLKVPAIPNTLNGRTSKIEHYSHNNKIIKREEFTYQSFAKKYLRGCFAIDSYAGPRNFAYIPVVNLFTHNVGQPGTIAEKIMAGRYNMSFYPINSSLDMVSKVKETYFFDKGTSLSKEKVFSYNNLGQLKSESLIESEGKVRLIEYKYAHETNSYYTQLNFLQAPSQITAKLDNVILNDQTFFYDLVSGKGPLLTQVYKTSLTGSQGDLTTKKYTYNLYSDPYYNSIAKINSETTTHGNGINNVSSIKGKKTRYLYGHNYKYIVAVIEGLDMDSNINYINEASFQNYAGTTLENYLNTNLRNNPQVKALNLEVTTYTYDTITGQVKTITDPNGQGISYHYDSMHRLQYITDNNGNVVQGNEYNYKN